VLAVRERSGEMVVREHLHEDSNPLAPSSSLSLHVGLRYRRCHQEVPALPLSSMLNATSMLHDAVSESSIKTRVSSIKNTKKGYHV
jgi:hypothetical protein